MTDATSGSIHWKRNLFVCLTGSFTTIVAMTLLLPFLPLYVEELGLTDHAAIVQWSGIAYGATFLPQLSSHRSGAGSVTSMGAS